MNKTDLRSQIADSFNKSELRSLCFDLGINYENLPGETLENKAHGSKVCRVTKAEMKSGEIRFTFRLNSHIAM
ncbi:hypothetical protein [Candidatus Leptofilum sp.]|uniref:hypothetical protein n=1 Tax=Candidatus Leptofilum sp. TaxID=3241576 RepID=UPI003B58F6AD